MKCVLDASMALAWVLEENRSDWAERAIESLGPCALISPSVWPLEVANALVMAVQGKRISSDHMQRAIRLLTDLEVWVAQEQNWPPSDFQIEAMLTHRLTAYDWTYIRLARQYRVPLLTLDEGMAQAAKAMDVELLAP